ncbi:type 2 isopentenyl-diphosphate Delta-isomerase [Cellulomonas triticagri]|uniref:Isopentenyl-diphosphate delta-isomerase n=1 Tax=Cellulomonas triticagri TaxID=2483352 RepID=A0A3M2JL97_9CELL|nr:type 2 isopentenyl-diphosphate Delta-isomerase [Cellulomonas triticagri]RMI13904.1 type 2 isopentenyl-diphosphate Delta-isomerase [Cellulomonas triticagri]
MTDPGAAAQDARRKDDHVRLASEQHAEPRAHDLDHVRFLNHPLAAGDRSQVSLRTRAQAFTWDVPLYINGMTGGTAHTETINRALALAARETGVPIASGSTGILHREPAAIPSFRVLRDLNPDGFVLANVNANLTPAQARRSVEILEADGLQVHINPAQEIVMPEGDRDFTRWAENIAAIVDGVGVPVVVKEVGAGMTRGTVERLRDLGVTTVDVSGRGGTDFTAIESARRDDGGMDYLAGWGQSAVEGLLDASPVEGVDLLASGGIRHPLDVVRALALGATAVGVAGGFLRLLLTEGEAALVARIHAWLTQVGDIMTLLGATTVADLRHVDVLLTGPVREFCDLRGIDAAAYARRSGL